jgi:hypothetical protein
MKMFIRNRRLLSDSYHVEGKFPKKIKIGIQALCCMSEGLALRSSKKKKKRPSTQEEVPSESPAIANKRSKQPASTDISEAWAFLRARIRLMRPTGQGRNILSTADGKVRKVLRRKKRVEPR